MNLCTSLSNGWCFQIEDIEQDTDEQQILTRVIAISSRGDTDNYTIVLGRCSWNSFEGFSLIGSRVLSVIGLPVRVETGFWDNIFLGSPLLTDSEINDFRFKRDVYTRVLLWTNNHLVCEIRCRLTYRLDDEVLLFVNELNWGKRERVCFLY